VADVARARSHEAALPRAREARARARSAANCGCAGHAAKPGLAPTQSIAAAREPPCAVARLRALQPPAADHATASGVVSAIADHVWTVGGTKVFVIDNKTVVSGAPGVGDTVTAEGLKTPDGAIIASTVRKQ
jgi:hypothetical protein